MSLTDRCNLRCVYCMPADGLPWLAPARLLTDDEIVRLVGIAVRLLGVTEVRLTGGEPTLRPGLAALVARLASLRPRPELSLTTNGLSLVRLAEPLRAAGLDRVNVSLDTLEPTRFARITRRDRHGDVLAGLRAAAAAGLAPVKVNSVLVRGVNDDEAARLLRWSLAGGYELRFIEQMPLDAQHGWQRSAMVTAAEILAALRAEFTLRPLPGRGQRARRAVRGRRWARSGRGDRLRLRPLLRGLRPGPADRRRPGAQLPVRPGGERSARGPARRRGRRAARRAVAGRGVGQEDRPRDRRARFPAAGPAHVGDRRMTAPRAGCSALVLAGGAARRLGGRDKPAVVVGGTTLLDRVLAAVAGAGTERIVVVGPRRQLAAPPEGGVWWCREDPPGGGPVAAIAAGLAVVATPFVAVLAADLPFLTGREIELLRRGAEEPAAHAAVLVDPGGRRQYLAAVWRTARLRAALPADPVGRPVRGLFTDQVVTSVRADALACLDCDAPADVARARRWAGRVRPGTM